MDEINMSFVRTIENKIEDCTTAIQLRQVLHQFSPYLYNTQVTELFSKRLNVIRNMHYDVFSRDKCDDFIEELQTETEISKVCTIKSPTKKKSTKGRKKDRPLESKSDLIIRLNFNSKEGSLFKDSKIEIIKIAIEKSLGKKREAARILGMDYAKLSTKIRNSAILRNYTKRVKKSVKNLLFKKNF